MNKYEYVEQYLHSHYVFMDWRLRTVQQQQARQYA